MWSGRRIVCGLYMCFEVQYVSGIESVSFIYQKGQFCVTDFMCEFDCRVDFIHILFEIICRTYPDYENVINETYGFGLWPG